MQDGGGPMKTIAMAVAVMFLAVVAGRAFDRVVMQTQANVAAVIRGMGR